MRRDPTSGPHRVPLIAGNWKMYKTSAEGAAFVAELAAARGRPGRSRSSGGPSVHRAGRGGRGRQFVPDQGGRAGHVLGGGGRLHRRGVRHDARRPGRERRHRRSFREAAVLRRDRRRRAKKVGAALEHGLLPIMCVGESEARAGGGHDRGGARPADRQLGLRCGNSRMPSGSHRLRAGVGHRYRQDRHARHRPGDHRFHQAAGCAEAAGNEAARACVSCTGAASGPTTSTS